MVDEKDIPRAIVQNVLNLEPIKTVRNEKGHYIAGNCANPFGRKGSHSLRTAFGRELVREISINHLQEAVHILIGIMKNPDAKDSDRYKCAKEIIDRGAGKVIDVLEVQDSRNTEAKRMTGPELMEAIAYSKKLIEQHGKEEPEDGECVEEE